MKIFLRYKQQYLTSDKLIDVPWSKNDGKWNDQSLLQGVTQALS
jgi:hypothetical protein